MKVPFAGAECSGSEPSTFLFHSGTSMSILNRLFLSPNIVRTRIQSPSNHRTFITLPDLSSLSPFSSGPGSGQRDQSYHERKILPYGRDELYRVVADVASYHKFIPFCTSSRVLKSSTPLHTHLAAKGKPDMLEMEGELTVSFLTFKESYAYGWDGALLPGRRFVINTSVQKPYDYMAIPACLSSIVASQYIQSTTVL
ncbi:hypothetical protein EW146_g3383 [Bondarzewia mesenterica]|uniref:Coenzyme Q-binding protein COQ10 START domain-containing protein n=1 Tax=Bondarzewia mesenterica TaxID=1095465 RepID=A0A4S4LXP4_9AGAM|nr:hypothetical protein EW146_g3383 [Bondarzewia mesenterica]